MYASFVIVVAIAAGLGTICAALIALYRVAKKVDRALNKECPCDAVIDLQEDAEKHREQMEKRKQQIEEQRCLNQEMDKRLSIAETETRAMREAIERIDRNVMKILTKG